MELGTMNKKLIIFSTRPTAAASTSPRWLAITVININATWMQPSCTATGTPNLKNAPSTSGWGRQVAALNVDVRAAALEPHEREGNAGCLRGHRAERRAHGAEPHVADKQKVERDVDDACHANHVHGRARIAQPAKDGRKNVVRGDKGNAHKADTQIGGSSFDCLGRRAMSATICGHSASRTAASTTETPIKSVMVLPMAVSARSNRREPRHGRR